MTSATAAPIGAAQRVPQWTFADRARKIRRDVLNMDQAEFANQLGVTRQAYVAWESGRNQPRDIVSMAKRIELISGVPASWVLGVDEPGVITQPDIGPTTVRYPTPSSTAGRRLRLVTGAEMDYRPVAEPPLGDYLNATGQARTKGADGTNAADQVNHAYAS